VAFIHSVAIKPSKRERYGNSGEGRIELELFTEEEEKLLVIAVKDNGIGIPIEKHDKIFEMFQTDKGDKGTGLGLAVSKRIIENHIGSLTVESQENEGAIFLVKIPKHHQKSSYNY